MQILEIPACLPDKEAIQRQVTAKLQAIKQIPDFTPARVKHLKGEPLVLS